MAFTILFCRQSRAVLPTQDSVLQQPLIPNLQTSVHIVCIRDKQEQAAQQPFAQGWCLTVTLTSLTLLHIIHPVTIVTQFKIQIMLTWNQSWGYPLCSNFLYLNLDTALIQSMQTSCTTDESTSRLAWI